MIVLTFIIIIADFLIFLQNKKLKIINIFTKIIPEIKF